MDQKTQNNEINTLFNKKTLKILIYIVLTILLLISIFFRYDYVRYEKLKINSLKINAGINKKEVYKIMGAPNYITHHNIKSQNKKLVYCKIWDHYVKFGFFHFGGKDHKNSIVVYLDHKFYVCRIKYDGQ